MTEYSNIPDGMKVLVVEDEYLIASSLCQELSARGLAPVGPYGCIERAMKEVDSGRRIDAAILDINIGGAPVFPLADRLVDRRVPFIFATGYDNWTMPETFLTVARFEKPLDPDTIIVSLSALRVRQPDVSSPTALATASSRQSRARQ